MQSRFSENRQVYELVLEIRNKGESYYLTNNKYTKKFNLKEWKLRSAEVDQRRKREMFAWGIG